MRTPSRLLFAVTIALTTLAATTQPFAPTTPPSETFNSGTLHIQKFGSGKTTLLLIPGLSCGPWVFSDTITHFSKNYTIYTLTLPGFDNHTPTEKRPLFATVTADIWTLLETKKIQKPIIIGHSLGGTLAFALATQHPERLTAIIAIDGLPVFPTLANATPTQRHAIATQYATMLTRQTPEDALTNERTYMQTVGTNRPELIDPTATLEARSDPKSTAAWLQEDLETDLRPDLPKATLPILELVPFDPTDQNPPGAATAEEKLSFYQSLLSTAPHAHAILIHPAKHFLMLDQPDQFYKAVTTFLTQSP